MAVQFRRDCDFTDFSPDYYAVREFLLAVDNPNYLFGRWDWMITHGWLDPSGLGKIGLWEDGGDMVALATYDCGLGSGYFCVREGYDFLKGEMLAYSHANLCREDGSYRALIADHDAGFQETAATMGFVPTQDRETDSVFPLTGAAIGYTLPDGYRITSMAEEYDLEKYGRVLWKGFDHEANGKGPYIFSEAEAARLEAEMRRPNVDLSIKIAVAAPDGSFAAYCGMWRDPHSRYALVEPVAADPAYRRMGLGKAAVLEGLKRCAALGAEKAYVGSSQPFYYAIGFRPHLTSTFWEKR